MSLVVLPKTVMNTLIVTSAEICEPPKDPNIESIYTFTNKSPFMPACGSVHTSAYNVCFGVGVTVEVFVGVIVGVDVDVTVGDNPGVTVGVGVTHSGYGV